MCAFVCVCVGVYMFLKLKSGPTDKRNTSFLVKLREKKENSLTMDIIDLNVSSTKIQLKKRNTVNNTLLVYFM